MAEEPAETEALLARVAGGERAAWGELLAAHEDKMQRMVAFRMDPRLRRRVNGGGQSVVSVPPEREFRPELV